ncbi:NAD(P)-dependent alcohol dehydrogenase [Alkalihalobacillus deserti]|uniref:NAD(P)-dependent alcohol dehydrogenase n=1 Tax=Alkalihalobacillus deserti TaxID=2879466 RepID=UPI0027E1751F|nr:NAD(P)-dependent alcohol dehydrogenase [Alkalihalobacillus deserti]
MLTKAAVTLGKGEPFQITELQIDEPKPGEVLVKIAGSGICHTDLVVRDAQFPVTFPIVLGHEGSGVVEKIGEGVTSVQPGDHVVLSFSSCGTCKNCHNEKSYACVNFFSLNFGGKMIDGTNRLSMENGTEVSSFFGQSSFANYAIASERNVVKVSKDVPIEMLGPLGCGIQTGCGAVMNKLKPEPGSTMVVFGCGSVGLSAIMAGKIVGCTTIIAVDVQDSRLVFAEELGATHTINSREVDSMAEIQKITKMGADYSLETSGRPEVLRQAVDCLASLGTCAVIGAAPIGTEVSLDIKTMRQERTITGVVEGSSQPQVFIPQMIELYKQGKLPFDKLISFYKLEKINQATEDTKNGTAIKPVILFE